MRSGRPESLIYCYLYKSFIYQPRRDEVTVEWRRLHDEELNDLYSSPNIVRVVTSRRMRWVGQVARMGEERGCRGSWWETGGKETTGET